MKKVKLTLQGKDPDMLYQLDTKAGEALGKFFEFSEYYEVEIVVDPETGKGTARFIEL